GAKHRRLAGEGRDEHGVVGRGWTRRRGDPVPRFARRAARTGRTGGACPAGAGDEQGDACGYVVAFAITIAFAVAARISFALSVAIAVMTSLAPGDLAKRGLRWNEVVRSGQRRGVVGQRVPAPIVYSRHAFEHRHQPSLVRAEPHE